MLDAGHKSQAPKNGTLTHTSAPSGTFVCLFIAFNSGALSFGVTGFYRIFRGLVAFATGVPLPGLIKEYGKYPAYYLVTVTGSLPFRSPACNTATRQPGSRRAGMSVCFPCACGGGVLSTALITSNTR